MQGMPFYSIETLLLHLHCLNNPAEIDSESVEGAVSPRFWDKPSTNDIVAKCFLSRFLEMECKYVECMQSRSMNSF